MPEFKNLVHFSEEKQNNSDLKSVPKETAEESIIYQECINNEY